MVSSGFLGEPQQGISGTLQEREVHGGLWGKAFEDAVWTPLRRGSKWAISTVPGSLWDAQGKDQRQGQGGIKMDRGGTSMKKQDGEGD